MDRTATRAKFGLDYLATERTFTMGIDRRFTAEMATRFCRRRVLETCTGAGFTTIALARVAAHVVTVEIEPAHQVQAKHNLAMAGLADRVVPHERQKLYMDQSHELYCLYCGELAISLGESEFRA
jgi:tRNA1(Val) A37 N6-methylase TrmN6